MAGGRGRRGGRERQPRGPGRGPGRSFQQNQVAPQLLAAVHLMLHLAESCMPVASLALALPYVPAISAVI